MTKFILVNAWRAFILLGKAVLFLSSTLVGVIASLFSLNGLVSIVIAALIAAFSGVVTVIGDMKEEISSLKDSLGRRFSIHWKNLTLRFSRDWAELVLEFKSGIKGMLGGIDNLVGRILGLGESFARLLGFTNADFSNLQTEFGNKMASGVKSARDEVDRLNKALIDSELALKHINETTDAQIGLTADKFGEKWVKLMSEIPGKVGSRIGDYTSDAAIALLEFGESLAASGVGFLGRVLSRLEKFGEESLVTFKENSVEFLNIGKETVAEIIEKFGEGVLSLNEGEMNKKIDEIIKKNEDKIKSELESGEASKGGAQGPLRNYGKVSETLARAFSDDIAQGVRDGGLKGAGKNIVRSLGDIITQEATTTLAQTLYSTFRSLFSSLFGNKLTGSGSGFFQSIGNYLSEDFGRDIRTFHTGTGPRGVPGRHGEEVPALLEAGEVVLSRKEASSYGGSVMVTQQLYGNQDAEMRRAIRSSGFELVNIVENGLRQRGWSSA